MYDYLPHHHYKVMAADHMARQCSIWKYFVANDIVGTCFNVTILWVLKIYKFNKNAIEDFISDIKLSRL